MVTLVAFTLASILKLGQKLENKRNEILPDDYIVHSITLTIPCIHSALLVLNSFLLTLNEQTFN